MKDLLYLGSCVPLLGSVPAYYREVYEAICCKTDEKVQVEVFQRLLQRTDLSKAVLGQVRGSHFTVGDKSSTRCSTQTIFRNCDAIYSLQRYKCTT